MTYYFVNFQTFLYTIEPIDRYALTNRPFRAFLIQSFIEDGTFLKITLEKREENEKILRLRFLLQSRFYWCYFVKFQKYIRYTSDTLPDIGLFVLSS